MTDRQLTALLRASWSVGTLGALALSPVAAGCVSPLLALPGALLLAAMAVGVGIAAIEAVSAAQGRHVAPHLAWLVGLTARDEQARAVPRWTRLGWLPPWSVMMANTLLASGLLPGNPCNGLG